MLFSVLGAVAARLLGVRAAVARFTPEDLLLLTALVNVPLLIGTLALARWLLRARPADLGLGRPTTAAVRYGTVFGLGLLVANVALALVQQAMLGTPPQQIATAITSHRGLVALALDLMAVSVLTPLAEELAFRGVLFGGLRQRLSFVWAAVLSAAVFALVHEPQAWPIVFFLGFGLALAYERTRTLWAPIVAHAVVNGVPIAFTALS